MFDEKTDEPFMGAERCPMNTKRCLLRVITIFVDEVESSRLGKIDLVGGDGELPSNHAPDLDVDLWSVESGFVRHFDKINPGPFQNVSGHRFGLFPKLRFVDKFLAEFGRIMSRETH